MSFKVTLTNYSGPQGLGASFWTANTATMSSLSQAWISGENGSGLYAEIGLFKSGVPTPKWWWSGIIPNDGHQYSLDVGNSALTDNGPVSGGNPPIITMFYADTYIFNNGVGGDLILYWNVTGATGINIDHGIGSVPASSQQGVHVAQTTTFTLTATNGYGTVSAQVTIQVNDAPPPPTGAPILLSFTSTPNPVQKGQAAELYWQVDPNGLSTSVSIDNGIGAVANTGTRQILNMQLTKVYTITATNSKGTTTRQLTVTVVDIVSYFTANPSTIQQGQSTVLAWSVIGAQTSISIDGIGAVAAAGSLTLSPSSTTAYTLRIEGPAGETTVEVVVTVHQTVSIISFTASKNSIDPGESVILYWSTSGATSAMVEYGAGQGQVPVNGQTTIGPLYVDTAVTLSVQGYGGPVTRTIQISAGGGSNLPVIVFTANPQTVAAGGAVTLSWHVTGALSVHLQGLDEEISGQKVVAVNQTTAFVLTADNIFGTSSSQVIVTVAAEAANNLPLWIAAGASLALVALTLLGRKK